MLDSALEAYQAHYLLVGLLQVSILIMLDSALEEWFFIFRWVPCQVSILIMLDSALEEGQA